MGSLARWQLTTLGSLKCPCFMIDSCKWHDALNPSSPDNSVVSLCATTTELREYEHTLHEGTQSKRGSKSLSYQK